MQNPDLHIESELHAELRATVRGSVIRRGDADYDAARAVYYSGLNRYPAAVVRPADPSDVARVVTFARERSLPLAVRSGGHGLAGHSVREGGIVIDLSSLREMQVDPVRRTAWAQTGLTAGEYTASAAGHGLATGFGDTPSVGIGGITLGGGLGFLHRKLGLTIDSVVAAEIVTADGEIRHVDESSEPELFWAIRGGGGNFGVVTRFLYRLHEIGPVTAGMLIMPASAQIVADFVRLMEEAPDSVSGLASVMLAPPMPFVPAEAHGKPIIFSMLMHAGEPSGGARAFAPFRALATPLVDTLKEMRYSQIYEGEGEPPKPARVEANCFFTDRVDAASGEAVLDALQRSRAPMRVTQFRALGGQVARVSTDATAFIHRDRPIMALAAAAYADPQDAAEHRAWATGLADTLRHGRAGAYVGFMGEEGEDRVREAYPSPAWERLREVKRRYDPTNLFRGNQNIPPADGR